MFNFNRTDSEKNKEIHDRDTKCYSDNICHKFPYLWMIKIEQNFQEPGWPFVSFSILKSLYFTHSFVLICFITRCLSLSLIVIFCYSLSFVVTRCSTHCHSFSFLLPFVVSCCHLLSLVGQLVVTRCTTLLSFFIDLQWWKTTFTVFRETFLTLVCTKSRKSDHIDMKFYTRTN